MILDGNLGVLLNEALVHQAVGLEELLQLPFDDLGNGLWRFVLELSAAISRSLASTSAGTCSRETDQGMARGESASVMSFTSCLNSSLATVLSLPAPTSTQHAHFGAGVNVSGHHAVAGHFHPLIAGNLDVLANLRHHALAVGFEVGLGVGRETFGDVIGKGAEHLVARHKIRLAIHLHQHTRAVRPGRCIGR